MTRRMTKSDDKNHKPPFRYVLSGGFCGSQVFFFTQNHVAITFSERLLLSSYKKSELIWGELRMELLQSGYHVGQYAIAFAM